MHKHPSTWGKFLNYAKWSYNTYKHSRLGLSPYKVTFGKKPFIISQYVAGTSNMEVVDDFLLNREAVFMELHKKLLKAQETMKHYADNNRHEFNFNVGDWVMVYLRPHR